MCVVLLTSVATAAPIVLTFSAPMTPDQEIPPPNLAGANNPQGFASATITYDDSDMSMGGTLMGQMSWSGLSSPAFMAHIHHITNPNNCRPDNGRCGTGPVVVPYFMTNLALPVGQPGGPLPETWSMTVNRPLDQDQLTLIVNGLQLDSPSVGALYFNLHTVQNPPGEIRGDITSFQSVPEPATYVLFSVGLVGMSLVGRRWKTRGERKHSQS